MIEDELNKEIQTLGWSIEQPLSPSADQSFAEDLAQFRRASVILDLGYYQGSDDADEGIFKVFVVEAGDWTTPLATLATQDYNLALNLLRLAAMLKF